MNTIEELVNNLHIFNPYHYDNLFKVSIRDKGESLYLKNIITITKTTGLKYICEVNDSVVYKVNITFNEREIDEIDDASCNCSKYAETGFMCPHIYAALIKIKTEDDRLVVIEKIEQLQNIVFEFRSLCRKFYLDNQKDIEHINPYCFNYSFEYGNTNLKSIEELKSRKYIYLLSTLKNNFNNFIGAKNILEDMLSNINDNFILKFLLSPKINELLKIHNDYMEEIDEYESYFK